MKMVNTMIDVEVKNAISTLERKQTVLSPNDWQRIKSMLNAKKARDKKLKKGLYNA
ncbi:hypothetical protein OIT44_03880 [Weissella ceti]|uniref:Uncharacterized protein n=1 Tax=Weissella ceti TaxID=759620 RepID=A0ABT3E476_9LACO|nr:hypothetical protein [Weissella ceti]MCW0953213.1 hypothetical protein [Weissella ceti]